MSTQPQRNGAGAWLDRWTPRVLKIFGLAGFAMSLAAFAITGRFEPTLFGGSLMAASGGYLGDAFNALRQGKPG